MIRFAEAWPDQGQVSALAEHLGWSHFKEILYLENELTCRFYAEMCRLEHWSVRTLRDRVRSMMFERTAISRLPEATIRQDLDRLRETDRLTPELVFRDPYLLDFLGLKDTYSERDLEAAILRELERFQTGRSSFSAGLNGTPSGHFRRTGSPSRSRPGCPSQALFPRSQPITHRSTG